VGEEIERKFQVTNNKIQTITNDQITNKIFKELFGKLEFEICLDT